MPPRRPVSGLLLPLLLLLALLVVGTGCAAASSLAGTSGPRSWVNLPTAIGSPDDDVQAFLVVEEDGSVIETLLVGRFRDEALAVYEATVRGLARQILFDPPLRVALVIVEDEWDILGTAYEPQSYAGFPGAPDPATAYPSALASHLAGRHQGSGPDLAFSLGGYGPWHFPGQERIPGEAPASLEAVVLHELVHGLGFSGTALILADGAASLGVVLDGRMVPQAFDRFVVTGDGTSLADLRNASPEMTAAITSGDLWFRGPATLAAAGGRGARLFAPSRWDPGSSVAHLDQRTYAHSPDRIMTPAGATPSDDGTAPELGPVTRAILTDLGWTLR